MIEVKTPQEILVGFTASGMLSNNHAYIERREGGKILNAVALLNRCPGRNGARRDAVTRTIENKFAVQSFMTSTTTRARETALEFGVAPHAFPSTQASPRRNAGIPVAEHGTFYRIMLLLLISPQIILRECHLIG
jgi:hypothetical protein